MTTSEQVDARPRFLMCRPRYFAVTYKINPWMDPAAWHQGGHVLHATAVRQWQGLFGALGARGARIELLEPEDGLPDLVFTANSAVVLDGKALLARFRYPQRQSEQPVFAAAFDILRRRGLIDEVITLPPGVTLEGAGDCLWDAHRRAVLDGLRFPLWSGGPRGSRCAIRRAVRRTAADRSSLLPPRHLLQSVAVRCGDVLSGRLHEQRH